MSHIVEDPAAPEVEFAPLRNLYELLRHLGWSPNTDSYSGDGFERWLAPLQHPWFRGVLVSRDARKNDARLIDETVLFFREAGVDGFTWWLDPEVDRGGWDGLLASAGFRPDEGTPGMVIDLQTLPPRRDTDLEIAVVDDAETQEVWATTVVAGFGMPSAEAQQLLDTMEGIELDLPVRSYVGRIAGEAVAASSLFVGAGVAGVYNVATLPDARGKGVGAAMTLAPLHDARDLGYRVGILQSSEMGFRVYERLGFRTTCPISHFYKAL